MITANAARMGLPYLPTRPMSSGTKMIGAASIRYSMPRSYSCPLKNSVSSGMIRMGSMKRARMLLGTIRGDLLR